MLTEQTPVAQIVLDHSECAPVLQRHHIDYCCRGDQPLAEACRRRGLQPAAVLSELHHAVEARGASPASDPRSLETAALIEQIERRHHRYLRDALPFLMPLAVKVARVHGPREPSLLEVRDTLDELADVLMAHVDDEERRIFPALRDGKPPRDLVEVKREHVEVGALFDRLRDAAGDYAVPEDACTSYTTLMRELRALEADVFEHVHLENHVLLPRFA